MGEVVGRETLRTGRVDLFQQHLGRGADLRLPAQQFREEKKNPFTGLLRLFAVIRQQLPDMILTVELQRQFPVGDVSPGTVERGGVLSALALAEDEVAVGGAAESGGAGDHVHGIIVIHLPQVMHQQNGDAVLVRQRFQNADVTIIAGVENGDITAEEFIDASEAICLDVTMSAVSSMLGEILIPVPILGAIIGNTVGMFMMNIARSYMSAEEQKLIEVYQKEMAAIKSQLDTEYKALIEKLEAELAEYDSLAALAFDADINIRFSSIISRARLVGANTDRLVSVEAGAELFTSGAPVVL